MKRILYLVLFFISNLSFGQGIENQIFELLCKDIVQDNKYYSIKQELKGVKIAGNPVLNDETLILSNKINAREQEILRKYKEKELLNILKINNYPIFPLTDTIFIVDTLSFFSKEIYFKDEHYCFKVIKSLKNIVSYPGKNILSIFAIGIRNDELILSFSFNSYDLLLNYYFKIESAKVILVNKKSVPLKVSYE